MSRALITEAYLTDIANAIRTKLGVQDMYTPPQMAAAIESIPTGGITPTGTKNITQNGTHDVTQYASANVNVQPNLQSKTATQNGTVVPDQGYDGLSSVVVNVSGGGGTAGEAVHIWTKSTGGSDAAIYVQNMLYDAATGNYTPDGAAVEVGYGDCQFSSAIYNCNGLVYLGYGNPQYSWALTAANDSIESNTTYKKGAYVGNWRYDTSIDFYIRRG